MTIYRSPCRSVFDMLEPIFQISSSIPRSRIPIPMLVVQPLAHLVGSHEKTAGILLKIRNLMEDHLCGSCKVEAAS